MKKTIAFQGVFGAYSHLACLELYPNATYLPCASFVEAFQAVQANAADLAVIPIENSNAGRVADVHFLLSETPLHIIGEYFLPIHHHLIGLPQATLKDIKEVHSHPQALAQCSIFLQKNKIQPLPETDTALSCRLIKENQDISNAAIASEVAAKLYDLKILASQIENAHNNTTRFLIMSKQEILPENDGEKFITSLIFNTQNIPSALYKALSGFAKHSINITKLESYLLEGKFVSARFYLEVEAHLKDTSLQNALSELKLYCKDLTILGTYKAHPYRYA